MDRKLEPVYVVLQRSNMETGEGPLVFCSLRATMEDAHRFVMLHKGIGGTEQRKIGSSVDVTGRRKIGSSNVGDVIHYNGFQVREETVWIGPSEHEMYQCYDLHQLIDMLSEAKKVYGSSKVNEANDRKIKMIVDALADHVKDF